jgi:hypothetical protein
MTHIPVATPPPQTIPPGAITGLASTPGLSWPTDVDLAGATRDAAKTLFDDVSIAYLAFRRQYYHEANPTLATIPPASTEVQQAHLAQVADDTLRLIPRAIRNVPLLGGLLDHLEEVANIHSMSQRERTALHNATMLFLHGVQDGIQPWYVTWLAASAERLSQVTHPDYFMVFPWDALLYLPPVPLAQFVAAVQSGDVAGVKSAMQALAARLIDALHDPIGIQPKLAFTGADGENRATIFHLQTQAALALGALLVLGVVKTTLDRPKQVSPPESALAAYPPEIAHLFVPATTSPAHQP